MTMMNHPVNTMTQAQNMDAMMKSMDPNMMFGMFGQPSEAYKNGETPEQLPVITIPGMPTQNFENWPKNTIWLWFHLFYKGKKISKLFRTQQLL